MSTTEQQRIRENETQQIYARYEQHLHFLAREKMKKWPVRNAAKKPESVKIQLFL